MARNGRGSCGVRKPLGRVQQGRLTLATRAHSHSLCSNPFPKIYWKLDLRRTGFTFAQGSGVLPGTLRPSHIFRIRHTENRLRDLPDKLIPSPNCFGFAIKIQGAPLWEMNRMVTTGHRVKKKNHQGNVTNSILVLLSTHTTTGEGLILQFFTLKRSWKIKWI